MFEFLKAGGPFMVLLVITSIIGLAVIIERGLALRWSKIIPPPIESALVNCRAREDVARLRHLCAEKPSPLSRLLLVAHEHLAGPRDESVDAVETRARHEVLRLERGLVALEVVVGIAPLLGLVGTIHGLITLFRDLGAVGLGDNAALARGIAIALNTTLMGLLIAIPSLIAWSYFSKKVETLAAEMATLCDEFIRSQHRTQSRN